MNFFKTFLSISLLTSLAASGAFYSDLYRAIKEGNAEFIATFAQQIPDTSDAFNSRDEHDRTVLMLSILYNQKECFDCILNQKNVNVNLANESRYTALHFAASTGNDEMCGALLQRGADVHAQNNYGSTPLIKAMEFRKNECAKMILRKYPKLKIKNEGEKTALDIAREKGNYEMIEILEIGEKVGVEEVVRLFLRERQSFTNIHGYVAGKGMRRPISLQNMKL